MNAPPFPTNPAFGQYFGNWVWSGSRWVCTNANGVRIVTQVFRASAPYTPSPGLITAVVECMGGGGSGGAADATQTAENIWTGGGGASGGYSRVTLASGLVLGGVNVIVGAGGDPTGAINFGNGLNTSFGSFCMASGGGAGGASQAGSYGGGAGPAGVGDIAFYGSGGMSGPMLDVPNSEFVAAVGGIGGQIFGGNSTVNTGKGNALPGNGAYPNSGAGGQGACINQMAAAVSQFGGAGGSGFCIVTEYCWADTVDDGCGCAPTGMARVAGPQGYSGWDGND
jgi:hypothetical protein